jgi:hypothetical protein
MSVWPRCSTNASGPDSAFAGVSATATRLSLDNEHELVKKCNTF